MGFRKHGLNRTLPDAPLLQKVSSWGRLGAWEHEVATPFHLAQARQLITQPGRVGLAYGRGRSYGDLPLNPGGRLWKMEGLDRFLAFDRERGIIRCEAGVLLKDIQRLCIPHGWALPVTPGTQFVTVGGAIAADVHGKSHHRTGAFGNHVSSLTLLRTDGEVKICTPSLHADWFAATVGGGGLTGVILEAELTLQKVAGPWLEAETIPYTSLAEFFHLSETSEGAWDHLVAWVDCLSPKGERGLFLRGNVSKVQPPSPPEKRTLTIPFAPPFSLVNPLSLSLFNKGYFHWNARKKGSALVHYTTFFYPLDHLFAWNLLYGPKGFYQYQALVPQEAFSSLLQEVARSGEGSFLAVAKRCGTIPASGMLSFTGPGTTLALDFPNRGTKTLALFDRLNALVREAKGRLYLAKDATMPPTLFEEGYPRLAEFLPYRDSGISSALSRRLMGY